MYDSVFLHQKVVQGKVSDAKMAENGTVWKSDYPRRHIYILGTIGLLLALGIIVLEVSCKLIPMPDGNSNLRFIFRPQWFNIEMTSGSTTSATTHYCPSP